MKRGLLIVVFSTVGLVLFSFENPLWAQKKVQKEEVNQSNIAIQGVWTQIYFEIEGKKFSTIWMEKLLAEPVPPGRNPRGEPYASVLWKISKDTIEVGSDIDGLPLVRHYYQVNLDGKEGTIDLFTLFRGEKKKGKDKTLGIFLLKDDFLMICFPAREGMGFFLGLPDPEGKRPKTFSTNSTKNWLGILRRGNLLK